MDNVSKKYIAYLVAMQDVTSEGITQNELYLSVQTKGRLLFQGLDCVGDRSTFYRVVERSCRAGDIICTNEVIHFNSDMKFDSETYFHQGVSKIHPKLLGEKFLRWAEYNHRDRTFESDVYYQQTAIDLASATFDVQQTILKGLIQALHWHKEASIVLGRVN